MTWFDIYVGCAVLMILISIALWFTLYSKVRHWLWWIIQLCLVVFVFHAGGHFFPSQRWLVVTHSSAVVNASLVLLAVLLARHGVAKVNRLEKEIVKTIEAVNVEHGAALQLTKLLNEYRDKIQYYEDQAARNGLPLLK